MNDALDIAEVVRRTGLTSRTLRFYEARGLVAPLRTGSGRRLYGRDELARINQIVALKRAGLCELIRQGVERQADAIERMPELFEGLDLEAIKDQWADLTRRIEAAMPIDPAGEEAQKLFDEVEPMFAPFFAWWRARGARFPEGAGEAPPQMDQMPGWPRSSAKVWQFLFAVKRHRGGGEGGMGTAT